MLDLIKKKYYAEVAKMYIKTESSVHEITKKGKKKDGPALSYLKQ